MTTLPPKQVFQGRPGFRKGGPLQSPVGSLPKPQWEQALETRHPNGCRGGVGGLAILDRSRLEVVCAGGRDLGFSGSARRNSGYISTSTSTVYGVRGTGSVVFFRCRIGRRYDDARRGGICVYSYRGSKRTGCCCALRRLLIRDRFCVFQVQERPGRICMQISVKLLSPAAFGLGLVQPFWRRRRRVVCSRTRPIHPSHGPPAAVRIPGREPPVAKTQAGGEVYWRKRMSGFFFFFFRCCDWCCIMPRNECL